MKDDPIALCPECAGAVKRLLYPVGIVFKGSGWYINDSRKPDASDSAPAASSKDGDSKSSDSSSTAGTDTKSEAKSETKAETKSDTTASASPAK